MGNEIEEWKSISNYENLYEISNFGNVRSLDKNRAYKNTTRNIIQMPSINLVVFSFISKLLIKLDFITILILQ